MLMHVAAVLKSALDVSDQVSRIGGDEFAVMRRNVTAPDALALADHMIALIGTPFEIEGLLVSIQASAGVAMSPKDGVDTEQLFKRADIALYASKDAGKGTARLFATAMEDVFLRRERLKSEVAKALDAQEFEIEYQPVIEIATGRVCRFEALLRWNHPASGRVSPAEFIPVAEETGAIVAIGDWVIRKACLAAATWPGDVGVAVNVSVRQFEPTLPLKIAGALSDSGLNESRLEIEITESVLMQGSDESLAILHQIRSLGVRISLDDFGTGYSSLSYLQRFPFHKLKIDRSFISGTIGTSEARAIVRSVIQLGHSLGMKVTAEGVETVEQLERMRVKGCDEAQGFLFSASVPSDEVNHLILRLNNGCAAGASAAHA
ncbi:EAL domain-containing protein (plasmid) [Mesorhizobium sp. INR15]|nr:EAL domain-containing protein [Mesorhizobium sp. INR15]